MDLKTTLLDDTTPQWYAQHRDYMLQHKARFHKLMGLFLKVPDQDYRLNQRATLIILEVEKLKPKWLVEQLGTMCQHLHRSAPVSLKRNLLRILQHHEIPQAHWGTVADECFYFLGSNEEPIAIKVFSMTVLYGLTRKIPELAPELRYLIEEQYPFGSAGFISRGRKVLAALAKDGH